MEATPRVLAPSAKITDPDSVPIPGNFGCAVAVSITGCATSEGLTEEESRNETAPRLTRTEIAFALRSAVTISKALVLVREPATKPVGAARTAN